MPHELGRLFVQLYYAVSPPLARLIGKAEALRAGSRALIAPIFSWAKAILAPKLSAPPSSNHSKSKMAEGH
jgi:hypothetical protein